MATGYLRLTLPFGEEVVREACELIKQPSFIFIAELKNFFNVIIPITPYCLD
jgi:hypothetical protein